MNIQKTFGTISRMRAMTTHVEGRAIILGPHEITTRVFAREFGHILGFRDAYFVATKILPKLDFGCWRSSPIRTT
jgi:hypothetical protein